MILVGCVIDVQERLCNLGPCKTTKRKVTAPPHQAFTASTKHLKETEGDKQSLSWPMQNQGTELLLSP